MFLDFLFFFASSLHSFFSSRFYFPIHFLLHVFLLFQLLLTFLFSLSIAVNYQWILSVIILNAWYQVWYVRQTWPSFFLNTDILSLFPFCRIFFLFYILFLFSYRLSFLYRFFTYHSHLCCLHAIIVSLRLIFSKFSVSKSLIIYKLINKTSSEFLNTFVQCVFVTMMPITKLFISNENTKLSKMISKCWNRLTIKTPKNAPLVSFRAVA